MKIVFIFNIIQVKKMDSYGAKLRIFPLIKNWIQMKTGEFEKCSLNENI